MSKKPTPKKKSASSSRTPRASKKIPEHWVTQDETFYKKGSVVIFDTAAGRVIGATTVERLGNVLLKKPAVMAGKYDRDGETVIPDLSPIAYAWEEYWVTWAGVRGHVEATGEYLDAYTEYLAARKAAGERKAPSEPGA